MSRTTDQDSRAWRVLAVALDATVDCRAMLDAAAMLAKQMGADLRGVWVQDADLHRLARLPFVSELAFGSERPRRLDTARLERTLAVHAHRLREFMAASADRRRVHWELRARTGDVETTLAAESLGADLLIVGHVKRLHHVKQASGQIASRLGAAMPVPVLLLPPGERVRGPVAVRLPASGAPGEKLMGVAIRFVRQLGGELLLLHARGSTLDVAALAGRLASSGITSRIVRLGDASASTLVAALEQAGGRLLLVETPPGAAPDAELLDRMNCPLLVMRGGSASIR